MAKTYTCPFCIPRKKFNRHKLPGHISKYHEDDIPENLTPYRFAYDIINNHPDHKGKCVVCGSDCEWNEKRQKYERLCGKKSCSEAIKKTYHERMMRVYNKPHLMDDVNHLEKMLAHRKISGKYKWSDGKVFTYTGSYEKNFLEFLDKVMEYRSDEIISPGPVLEYDYKGKKHKWITDVMILPYNLIVEIKDGGDNKNGNTAWKGTRAKTIAKEVMITNLGKYNYIRLTNNDFAQFLGIIAELKMQIVDDTVSPLYRIHENTNLDEAFDVTKIFIQKGIDDLKSAFTGIGKSQDMLKRPFGEKLKDKKLSPSERAENFFMGLITPLTLPGGIIVDIILSIVKLAWDVKGDSEKPPEPKSMTTRQLKTLKKAIDKAEQHIKDEEKRIYKIYQELKSGRKTELNETCDFEEILMNPKRYPGLTERNLIQSMKKSTDDEYKIIRDYNLDKDDPKEKKIIEWFEGKHFAYISDLGGNGWLFCVETEKFYDHDHENPSSLLDKEYTMKDIIAVYKKYPYYRDNPGEECTYIGSLYKDLEELKNKYERYKKLPLKEDTFPEAIDNPYMLREAQDWEHLTHMWGNAIDDIIGNVTNSPFEVAKGSYIDHDPETGKEVCVMRTIRPKAELKNREYRDRLKKQMYHLQQKINKAYNVHPSVMFIQYPIDNTNLTEGLIIGITKTSR